MKVGKIEAQKLGHPFGYTCDFHLHNPDQEAIMNSCNDCIYVEDDCGCGASDGCIECDPKSFKEPKRSLIEKIKWMLKWCDSYDDGNGHHFHGKETFNSKDELLERLDVLKFEYRDSLEFQYGQAKQVMMQKWTFLSDLKKEGELEISKRMFENDKVQPTILDFI
jgi:hypothetical protein